MIMRIGERTLTKPLQVMEHINSMTSMEMQAVSSSDTCWLQPVKNCFSAVKSWIISTIVPFGCKVLQLKSICDTFCYTLTMCDQMQLSQECLLVKC